MSKRFKTKYPGVFFRESKRIGGNGTEKVFYILFKKDGKGYEEKAGRQYSDGMTPARAAYVRSERIEGKRKSRKEIRAQEEAVKQAEADKWTVDRLWEKYKKENPKLKGWPTYESTYNLHIKPNFANKEPKDILPLDIRRIKNKLLKKRSPQTVFHVIEQLRRIINFGVNNKLCDGIDFKINKKSRLLPKVDNIKTEKLTDAQLVKLLKAIDADQHPQAGSMMKFVLFTGCRRGELFRLRWKHINFEDGFIKLINTKGGKNQLIPLNDAARDLLSNHTRTESPYVFPGRNGGQRVNIGKQVRKIADNAQLPKSFRPLHGLRHVYASMLANSGKVTMYTLQKLLTHKDSKMTERYSHLRNATLKNASNLAGQIVKAATEAKVK
jgi:integrase